MRARTLWSVPVVPHGAKYFVSRLLWDWLSARYKLGACCLLWDWLWGVMIRTFRHMLIGFLYIRKYFPSLSRGKKKSNSLMQVRRDYIYICFVFCRFALGDDVITQYIQGIQFLPVCIMVSTKKRREGEGRKECSRACF